MPTIRTPSRTIGLRLLAATALTLVCVLHAVPAAQASEHDPTIQVGPTRGDDDCADAPTAPGPDRDEADDGSTLFIPPSIQASCGQHPGQPEPELPVPVDCPPIPIPETYDLRNLPADCVPTGCEVWPDVVEESAGTAGVECPEPPVACDRYLFEDGTADTEAASLDRDCNGIPDEPEQPDDAEPPTEADEPEEVTEAPVVVEVLVDPPILVEPNFAG